MNRSPRVHTPAFKAQVALKGDKTLTWKKQMLEQASTVFASSVKPVSFKESEAKQAELFEQIGRLKMELEWLKKAAAFV